MQQKIPIPVKISRHLQVRDGGPERRWRQTIDLAHNAALAQLQTRDPDTAAACALLAHIAGRILHIALAISCQMSMSTVLLAEMHYSKISISVTTTGRKTLPA